MENATKALVIAGTVLIAILILSVGIYIFHYYMDFAYKNEENQAKQALIQYNTKFEKYIDKELTIQDVLTIANLAKDYNERKSVDGISVHLNSVDLLKKLQNENEWVDQLTENKYNKYKMSIDPQTGYYKDGTIKEIKITKQ